MSREHLRSSPPRHQESRSPAALVISRVKSHVCRYNPTWLYFNGRVLLPLVSLIIITGHLKARWGKDAQPSQTVTGIHGPRQAKTLGTRCRSHSLNLGSPAALCSSQMLTHLLLCPRPSLLVLLCSWDSGSGNSTGSPCTEALPSLTPTICKQLWKL